ncbi:MAG: hypothetical protein IJS47_02800 [Clostridia bacterium]|nr:hypothetical protein [Clostridia bacterium]
MGDFEGLGRIMLGFFGVIALVFLIYFVFKTIFWIFKSIGLHKIGKDHGIEAAWLAWLPVGDLYVLGSVSDRIKKIWKIKNMGVFLVLLSLAQIVVIGIGIVVALIPYIHIFSENLSDLAEITITLSQVFKEVLKLLVELAAGVVYIFRLIALYQIYSEYVVGDKKILYIVLSIILPFMQSIFLFTIKDKPIIRNQQNVPYVNTTM